MDKCQGCGMNDPCGYHYDDCTLLEPGDIVISRVLGSVMGYIDLTGRLTQEVQ